MVYFSEQGYREYHLFRNSFIKKNYFRLNKFIPDYLAKQKKIFKISVLVFAILFLIPNEFLCQLDTFQNKIKILTGKKKVDYIVNVLQKYSENDTLNLFTYAKDALKQAEEIGYKSGEADVLFEMSVMYFNFEEFKKALAFGLEALNIRKNLDDKAKTAHSYTFLAINYEYFGKYDSASSALFKAIQFAEESKSKKELANAYNALGLLNYVSEKYEDALEYTHKALKIRESIGDNRGIISSLENFGLIYMNLKDYNRAISYHTKILELKKEIGTPEGIAGTLDNLGICYMRTNDFARAQSYFNEALEIRKVNKKKKALASSYSQLGSLYSLQGNHSKSLEFLLKSYSLRKRMQDNRGMISSLKKITAEYVAVHDYVNAYKYSELFHARQDSTFNENSLKQMNELNSRLKSELKDKEIAILQKDVDLAKMNRIIYTAAIVVASLIALFFFFSSKTKKKTNLLLVKQNDEIIKQKEELSVLNTKLKNSNSDKDKLFSIIAHDLKNPFNAVLGFSEILKNEFEIMNDEDKAFIINGIYDSSRNTYKLLENLLNWSRLQTGRMNCNPAKTDLFKEVVDAIEIFKTSASAKGIVFVNDVLPGTIAYCDSFMIDTVLRNLLSNAVKFSFKGGVIAIDSIQTLDSLQLSVADHGVGMREDELDDAFEIEKVLIRKGTSNEEGTGLGLILCKEFVKKNKGEIWAESKPGKGSTFFIKLPIKKTLA